MRKASLPGKPAALLPSPAHSAHPWFSPSKAGETYGERCRVLSVGFRDRSFYGTVLWGFASHQVVLVSVSLMRLLPSWGKTSQTCWFTGISATAGPEPEFPPTLGYDQAFRTQGLFTPDCPLAWKLLGLVYVNFFILSNNSPYKYSSLNCWKGNCSSPHRDCFGCH